MLFLLRCYLRFCGNITPKVTLQLKLCESASLPTSRRENKMALSFPMSKLERFYAFVLRSCLCSLMSSYSINRSIAPPFKLIKASWIMGKTSVKRRVLLKIWTQVKKVSLAVLGRYLISQVKAVCSVKTKLIPLNVCLWIKSKVYTLFTSIRVIILNFRFTVLCRQSHHATCKNKYGTDPWQ